VVIIHIMKNGKSRLEVVILDNSDCLLDNWFLICKLYASSIIGDEQT
jgi:hypothetical protein